jgi:hypothetical protein
MRIILGAVLIFAAAWLMYRLQAGSGSCCGGGYDRNGSDLDHEQVCCVDKNASDQNKKGI